MSVLFTLFNGTSTETAKQLKSLFCTPMIGAPMTAYGPKWALATVGALATAMGVGGVPIRTESYEVTRESEIGKQIMIRAKGGAEQVTDNIVPTPRRWTVKGYIDGIVLERVNYLVSALTSAAAIQAQKAYIEWLSLSRIPCQFRTNDGEFVAVFIKNYTFKNDATIENAQPVELILHEANILSLVKGLDNIYAQNTSAAMAGTVFGAAKSIGLASALALTFAIGSSFDQLAKSRSWTQADRSVADEEPTNPSSSVYPLELLKEDINPEDEAYYVSVPSTLCEAQEDGTLIYADHSEFSVSAGGFTLLMRVRADRDANAWYISEELSRGGEVLTTNETTLAFNVLMHKADEYYSYVILNELAPLVPEEPTERLTEPDPSEYGGVDDYLYINALSLYTVNVASWEAYDKAYTEYIDAQIKALSSSVLVFIARGQNV